jgi:hypothetical protein
MKCQYNVQFLSIIEAGKKISKICMSKAAVWAFSRYLSVTVLCHFRTFEEGYSSVFVKFLNKSRKNLLFDLLNNKPVKQFEKTSALGQEVFIYL